MTRLEERSSAPAGGLADARRALVVGNHGEAARLADGLEADAASSDSERAAARRMREATRIDPVALVAGALMFIVVCALALGHLRAAP